MGSIRINEEKSAPDSDTSGLGTFGLVEVQTSQLEYLERIGQCVCVHEHPVINPPHT